MFLQLTARNRHFVTVGLPMIALLGAFGIAYPRYQALKADEAALAQTQREIAAKQSLLTVLQARPRLPIVARVPATPDEPVEFLRNLNMVARSCGVKIETYTAGAAAPTPAPAPPPSGGAAVSTGDTLPPGTTASTLEITAEGTYAAMTRFFQRLETYPRLINVSQVSMQTKKYPLLTTKFQLSRYTGLSPESAAL
jgi:hypothetical protein